MAEDRNEIIKYLARAFKVDKRNYRRIKPLYVSHISLPDLGGAVCAACRGTGYMFFWQTSGGIEVVRKRDGLRLLVRRGHIIPSSLDSISIEGR